MDDIELPPDEARDRVLAFLDQRRVMTLATARDGVPWTCTVAFAHDPDINLYFVSDPKTRHCEDLEANPRTAIAMHEPQETYDRATVRGLQATGKAARVRGVAALSGLRLFAARFGADLRLLKDVVHSGGVGVHRVRLDRAWFLDQADLGGRLQVVPAGFD